MLILQCVCNGLKLGHEETSHQLLKLSLHRCCPLRLRHAPAWSCSVSGASTIALSAHSGRISQPASSTYAQPQVCSQSGFFILMWPRQMFGAPSVTKFPQPWEFIMNTAASYVLPHGPGIVVLSQDRLCPQLDKQAPFLFVCVSVQHCIKCN